MSTGLVVNVQTPLDKFKEMHQEDTIASDDQELFDKISNLISQLENAQDNDSNVISLLESLRNILIDGKTSMSGLPKQFSYMTIFLEPLETVYNNASEKSVWKKYLADLLSVLSMIKRTPGSCLKYRMEGNNHKDLDCWPMEYIKHLIDDLREEYHVIICKLENGFDGNMHSIKDLGTELIEYCYKNNADIEMIDLATELGLFEHVFTKSSENNYKRNMTYVKSLLSYYFADEKNDILENVCRCYAKFGDFSEAMVAAVRMRSYHMIIFVLDSIMQSQVDFIATNQNNYLKQMTYILYSYRISIEDLEAFIVDSGFDANIINKAFKIIKEVPTNSLSEFYESVGRELDLTSAKKIEDIYKDTGFSSYYSLTPSNDSARSLMANLIVSSFVNCGFKSEEIAQTIKPESIRKLNFSSALTSIGSLALLYLWDVESGLLEMDKYLASDNHFFRSGGCFGAGVLSCNNPEAIDTTFVLLCNVIETEESTRQEKVSAIISIGMALIGTNNTVALDYLNNIFEANKEDDEQLAIISSYSLAVGMIAIGSVRKRETHNLITYISEKRQLFSTKDAVSSYVILGYGLLYFASETMHLDVIAEEDFSESFHNVIITIMKICCFAGTGNEAIIQQLVFECHPPHKEDLSPEEEKDLQDSMKKNETSTTETLNYLKKTTSEMSNAAKKKNVQMILNEINDQDLLSCISLVGIGIVASGEETGSIMAFKLFSSILQYATRPMKKIIPIAIALLSVSNPQVAYIDTLTKLSHEADSGVASSAILGLGIIGAGTNNAKILHSLRNIKSYFYKEPINIFAARTAVGLVQVGKGMVTMSPSRANGCFMDKVSLASLFLFSLSCIGTKQKLLNNETYLILWLACGFRPKFLVTIDENGNQVNVPVRVGLMVDVAGQAGEPRIITGFQTHTTPVLINTNERAEFVNDEYLPMSSILEGVVIVVKNIHSNV